MNLELKEFKIDRSKWRTGDEGVKRTGLGRTQLKNKQGFMCCLGQCSEQMGVKKIKGYAEPEEVISFGSAFTEENGLNSNLSGDAMHVNDDKKTTPEEKENLLMKLFKADGLTIEFFGEYHKPSHLQSKNNKL